MNSPTEDHFDLRTRLARAESAEAQLREAVDVAGIGFFEWEAETDRLTMSERFRRDWGTSADVTTKWGLIARVWDTDRERIARSILDAVRERQSFRAEFRVRRPDDRGWLWVEVSGNVALDDAGQLRRIFGTSVDVSARKALESDTRSMAEAIPQLAWMTDATGAILWYNQRWFEYTGTTLAQMKDWGWRDVHDPVELPRVLAKWKHHVASGEPWEDTFPLRGADGGFRWFLSRANPIRDEFHRITRWFGTNTDVTEQRETARHLTQLAAIVESSADFITVLDAAFRPVLLNSAGRRMVCFDGDLTALGTEDFLAAGDRDRMRSEILPAVADTGSWCGELGLNHRDGGGRIPVLYTMFRGERSDFGLDHRLRRGRPRYLRTQSLRGRPPGRTRGGRARQPGQERVFGQRQSRDPFATRRDYRFRTPADGIGTLRGRGSRLRRGDRA